MKKAFKQILDEIDFDNEFLSEGHIHHIISKITTERKTKTKQQKIKNISNKHKNKNLEDFDY